MEKRDDNAENEELSCESHEEYENLSINKEDDQAGAVVEVEQSHPSQAAPKPLKSILKKRKPQESLPTEEESTEDHIDDVPKKKPNFGGSITEALKKIKEVSPSIAENKRQTVEPEPSAFIREMEKQNAMPSSSIAGVYGFPFREPEGIGVNDMMWGGKGETPFPGAFGKNHYKEAMKRKKEITALATHEITESAKSRLRPHEANVNCVVVITNLPYKVTRKNLVTLIGVWPKGGYEGVYLISESNGLPAGHAYIVLEKHSDMMNIIRMTGFTLEGRKIKTSISSFKSMKRDLMVTKKAMKTLELSRVSTKEYFHRILYHRTTSYCKDFGE